jgi:hypothetical protein
MVSEGRMHVPTNISLAVIGCVLALAMLLSLALPKKQ